MWHEGNLLGAKNVCLYQGTGYIDKYICKYSPRYKLNSNVLYSIYAIKSFLKVMFAEADISIYL